MKLHQKMAIPRRLEQGYLDLESIDKDENEEERNRQKDKEEKQEVEEARTRQVYDCVKRVYDERRQRITDLKECSRIFLPKPLEVTKEAQLEMRREVHKRLSEEYRRDKRDERGRQERNLTIEEQRGLKKLEKRKNDGEIVITMTDKSSKMCVMKREEYLRLGEVHVGGDKEIDRPEIQRRERTLNQHTISLLKMWRTGQDHGHKDRIRQSKFTNSENRAELYLSYKDHKKVPGKTRAIATGCTSDTLALSNSLSNLGESLANAEEEKMEEIYRRSVVQCDGT